MLINRLKALLASIFFWPDPSYMAGTTGSGDYEVAHITRRGRVGVRQIPGGWRIRVEPMSVLGRPIFAGSLFTFLLREDGWRQPGDGGQVRFSKVVYTEDGLRKELASVSECLNHGAQSRGWHDEIQGSIGA